MLDNKDFCDGYDKGLMDGIKKRSDLDKLGDDIHNGIWNKAIDEAIDYFGEELDRLVRTQQIDMIHTNIDKIIEDATKQLKKEGK